MQFLSAELVPTRIRAYRSVIADLGNRADDEVRQPSAEATSQAVICSADCGRPDPLSRFPPGARSLLLRDRGLPPDHAVARLEAAGLAQRRRENRVYFDDLDGLVQISADG